MTTETQVALTEEEQADERAFLLLEWLEWASDAIEDVLSEKHLYQRVPRSRVEGSTWAAEFDSPGEVSPPYHLMRVRVEVVERPEAEKEVQPTA